MHIIYLRIRLRGKLQQSIAEARTACILSRHVYDTCDIFDNAKSGHLVRSAALIRDFHDAYTFSDTAVKENTEDTGRYHSIYDLYNNAVH